VFVRRITNKRQKKTTSKDDDNEDLDDDPVLGMLLELKTANVAYACTAIHHGLIDGGSKAVSLDSIAMIATNNQWDDAVQLWRTSTRTNKQQQQIQFRVTCYRQGHHVFQSTECARALGSGVVGRYKWKVNLYYPDLEVYLRVIGNDVICGVRLYDHHHHHHHHQINTKQRRGGGGGAGDDGDGGGGGGGGLTSNEQATSATTPTTGGGGGGGVCCRFGKRQGQRKDLLKPNNNKPTTDTNTTNNTSTIAASSTTLAGSMMSGSRSGSIPSSNNNNSSNSNSSNNNSSNNNNLMTISHQVGLQGSIAVSLDLLAKIHLRARANKDDDDDDDDDDDPYLILDPFAGTVFFPMFLCFVLCIDC